jgi:hypothetical protein
MPADDELTAIKIIDPTIEMALNSLGIHRYEDFEGRTAEQLADDLMRRGVSITSDIIVQQNWIGQAQALAHKSPTLDSSTPEADTAHKKDEIARAPEVQAQHEAKPTPLQLAPPPVSEKPEEKAKPQEAADEAAVLQIKSARFAKQDASHGPGFEKKLLGEIVCELAAPRAFSKKAEPMTLCTQIHAVDLTTSASELLASKSQAISAAREKYQSTMDFETPNPGRYRLQVVALLLGAQPNVATCQGPILRVES